MIYYSTDLYKFKRKSYRKLDQLIKKQNVTEVSREEELRSVLNKETDVFCVIFEEKEGDEINRCLIWDESEDQVLDKYWTLCDEI